MALLTKDIVLSYKVDTTYTNLTNLQEIPDIGNNVPEKLDITVLTDNCKKSISGLSDSAQDLAFTFLYDQTQFNTLAAMTGTHDWKITFSDGENVTFSGTPSIKMSSAGVDAVMNYTLTVSVESLIAFNAPVG